MTEGEPRLDFRDMTEADLEDGLRLSPRQRLEPDARGLAAPPLAGPGALPRGRPGRARRGRPAGAVRYGDALAWICMILVDPEQRGHGLGTRIFDEVLDRCEAELRAGACVRGPRRDPGRPRHLRASAASWTAGASCGCASADRRAGRCPARAQLRPDPRRAAARRGATSPARPRLRPRGLRRRPRRGPALGARRGARSRLGRDARTRSRLLLRPPRGPLRPRRPRRRARPRERARPRVGVPLRVPRRRPLILDAPRRAGVARRRSARSASASSGPSRGCTWATRGPPRGRRSSSRSSGPSSDEHRARRRLISSSVGHEESDTRELSSRDAWRRRSFSRAGSPSLAGGGAARRRPRRSPPSPPRPRSSPWTWW